jgi:hypothetical protein
MVVILSLSALGSRIVGVVLVPFAPADGHAGCTTARRFVDAGRFLSL